jgi:alpha-D-ribose 1-methylphosphonate 5-triphosphate synthase subunit PhnG
MALAARAREAELAEPLARHWPDLQVRELKAPEIGLVMVRGRMGGDGAPFNLGEATVTRAVVEIGTGHRGHGQMLGRKPKLARLAAIADALWQDEAARPLVEDEVLRPIRQRLDAERAAADAETAATRVDFFTLVRGDPET